MIDLPWAAMIVVGGAFLAVFATGEIAHRKLGIPADDTRRLVHATAGVVALPLPAIFSSSWPVLLLSTGFFVFLVVTRRTGHLASIHGIGRSSVGAFLYPVAIAATFVLAHDRPTWYAVAVGALAFADAAGGLVGSRLGRRRFASWGQPKSVEGSAAALAAATLTSLVVLVAGGTPATEAALVAVLVGLVVATVEAALPWGLDNLGVPLAALASLAVVENLPPPLGAGLALLGALSLLWLAALRSERIDASARLTASDAR